MGTKWDIDKFTGDNDFWLWKVNMQAILIQPKCVKELKGKAALLATMSQPYTRLRWRTRRGVPLSYALEIMFWEMS